MSARLLPRLALVFLLAAGCETGAAGSQVLSSIGAATGLPGFQTAANLSQTDMRGAFTDMDEPEEVELGRAISAAVGARYKVLRDRALTQYVALVGNTVAATSDRPDLRYYFAVLDSPDINALASPGGFVFVTRGALNLMKDEAALAGVLGHEVGHIALRHHGETIKAQKRKTLALAVGQEALAYTKVRAFSSLIGLTADAIAEQVILKGHSRAEEMESDKVGFQYAARAGYDPAGLREFLATLAARGGQDAGAQKFFSTHPGTEDRLQEQAKLRKDWTGGGRREAARFARALGR
jgi:beta-barrel assembly-enhancing protease